MMLDEIKPKHPNQMLTVDWDGSFAGRMEFGGAPGVMDWAFGRQQQEWSWGRSFARDFAATFWRGLIGTVATGVF